MESEFLKQFVNDSSEEDNLDIESPFLRGFANYDPDESEEETTEEVDSAKEEEDEQDVSFESPEEEISFRRDLPGLGRSASKDYLQPNRSSAAPMSKNDRAITAYNILRSNPYNSMNHNEAVAYVGNLIEESGNFSEDVIVGKRRGDNGSAFGIAQWRGDRLSGLYNFAKRTGGSPTSLETQANYLAYETATTEKQSHSRVRASNHDLGAATRAVNKFYERSADKTNKREKNSYSFEKTLHMQSGGYAQAGLPKFQNHIDYSPIESKAWMQGYGSNGVQYSPTDIAGDWFKNNKFSSIVQSPETIASQSKYFNNDPGIIGQGVHTTPKTGIPQADLIMEGVSQADNQIAGYINGFKNIKDTANNLKDVMVKGVSGAATVVTSILSQNQNEDKYYKMMEDIFKENKSQYSKQTDNQNLSKSFLL